MSDAPTNSWFILTIVSMTQDFDVDNQLILTSGSIAGGNFHFLLSKKFVVHHFKMCPQYLRGRYLNTVLFLPQLNTIILKFIGVSYVSWIVIARVWVALLSLQLCFQLVVDSIETTWEFEIVLLSDVVRPQPVYYRSLLPQLILISCSKRS